MSALNVLRDDDVRVEASFGFEPLRASRLPPQFGGPTWLSCSKEEYPLEDLFRGLAQDSRYTLVDARCSDRDPSYTGAFRLLFLSQAFWPASTSAARARTLPPYVLPNLVRHAHSAWQIQWARQPVMRNDHAGPMVLRIHLMPPSGLDTFELFGRRYVRRVASCAAG